MGSSGYLLSLSGNKSDLQIAELIRIRETQWLQQHGTSALITRLRIQQSSKEAVICDDDVLNRVFVLKSLWSNAVCTRLLDAVNAFAHNSNAWTTQRHRNHATTDIPSHCVGYELDEYLRQLLHETLYPLIVEKYALNKRLHADVEKGEFVQMGIRDLFFVKYD